MTDASVLGIRTVVTDLDDRCDRLTDQAWLKGRGLQHMKAALRRNRLVILDEAA